MSADMSRRLWHERLNLRWPLVQAPMAGSQDDRLAIAVGRAGALGSLPAALWSPAQLTQALERVHASGVASINVNFFCHDMPTLASADEARWLATLRPYDRQWGIDRAVVKPAAVRTPIDDAMVQAMRPFAPRVVSFHFGLPSPAIVDAVKSWGASIWASATTVHEACWLEAHGCDVVIAQGLEAGGHRGMFGATTLDEQRSTLELLERMVQAVACPVIAAGGLHDARGVSACMARGAAGVQVGTAFLGTHEATTSRVHRLALKRDDASQTALTRLFSGRAARGIVNRLMRDLGPMNDAAPAFPHASSALAPLRAAAEAQGMDDFTPLWSGQGGCPLHDVDAAVVVERLVSGFGTA